MKNYRNANKGKYLESMIEISNKQYLMQGVAQIDKIATPTQVKRQGGELVGAFYTGKSTVDFIGIRNDGLFIAFDAKETSSNTLPFNAVKQHQFDYLTTVDRFGGAAFILVLFKKVNELYMITIKEFTRLQKELTRLSIPLQWFQDNKQAITSSEGVTYNYLLQIENNL